MSVKLELLSNNQTLRKNIVSLATKNNFYTDMIWYMMLGRFPPSFKPEGKNLDAVKDCNNTEIYNYWSYNLYNEEDKLIGFFLFTQYKDNPTQCLGEFLLVDNKYRGRGYGRKILDYVVDDLDTKKLDCQLFLFNKEPSSLYQEYGWKPEKRNVFQIMSGLPASYVRKNN